MEAESDGPEIRNRSAVLYGDWVVEEMRRCNWDQATLARRANLKKQTVGSIVHGAAMQPTAWQIAAIARAFRVDPNTIFAAIGLIPAPPDGDAHRPPLDVYLRETQALRDDDIEAVSHLVRRLAETATPYEDTDEPLDYGAGWNAASTDPAANEERQRHEEQDRGENPPDRH